MQLMNIYPVGNLQAYKRQDMNMFLTHLALRRGGYKRMAKNHPGYKILDNSLIELGEAMDFGLVLEVAREIEADEVVLPDKFMDGEETYKMVNDALSSYEDDFKVMAVVHGKDKKEVRRIYKSFLEDDRIDVLGIPKVWTAKYGNRSLLLNELINEFGVGNKEIHLLGLWDRFSELEDLEHVDKIRSIDTSLGVLYDIMGKRFDYVRKDEEVIDLEGQVTRLYSNSLEAIRFVKGLE